jgi:flagellar M-ring protein FliF
LSDFIKNVGAARFGVMAGVAAVLTAFFLYVAGVISEPAKTILYAGPRTARSRPVTAKLDAMNVPYEAKGDGGTILVPADQVTKLRMELASEIFRPPAWATRSSTSPTRSAPPPSSRTSTSCARSKANSPAPSRPSTASTPRASISSSRAPDLLARGPEPQRLGRAQDARHARPRPGAAIQHLVAAAVAGLEPARVAIVDDKGDLLAGGEDKTGAEATSSDEEETTTFEDRLRQRIESMVASVVGPGHVRVQVAADMNYNHVSETSETYDPDSKVVRSTQTVEQNATDAAGGNNGAVSVASALPGGQQASQGNGSGTQIEQHAHRGNDQLRDLEDRSHQHAGRRPGQKIVGGGRRGRRLVVRRRTGKEATSRAPRRRCSRSKRW